MIASDFLGRVLAVGLLGLALALGWLIVLAPINAFHEDIRRDIAKYGRLKTHLAADIRLGQADLSSGDNPEAYRQDFLPAGAESAIIAGLQKQIGSLIASNGSELMTAQALPGRNDATTGVRVHLRGPIDKVQLILHAVEVARPLSFIERAVVRADPSAPQIAGVSGLAAIRLSVELDIYGTRWSADQAAERTSR